MARGITDAEIRSAVGRGDLVRLTRGSYIDATVFADLDLTGQQRLWIQAAARCPGWVISHASAALRDGRAVTCLARSVVDLAQNESESAAAVTVDAALRRGDLPVSERSGGLPGSTRPSPPRRLELPPPCS